MADPLKPENQVLVEAVRANAQPIHVQGYVPCILNPITGNLQLLEQMEPPHLHHIEQKPTFRDVGSFINYVERFKDARTQLFADERKGSIVAILDYHLNDETEDADRGIAMRCAHVATFAAEASPEWKEWKELDGKAQSQEAFATFIENQAPFIVRPDAATMLEISLSMQAASSHTYSKAIRLDNGQVQFQYLETINGQAGPKGHLEIPKDFDVQLRPFLGNSPYKITARFRYRIEGGRLAVWYDLFRAADVQREAFDAVISRVTDEVEITPYIGAP